MSKEAAWLLRELPALVEKGLLDEATAARLRSHYAVTPGLGWDLVLLAIGGAALIGLGVILIFAHNWENWTPELRVLLSLVPLLAGQLACVQALRNGSRLWGEGAGLFTALAVGASIALIAQTYQFGGDLPRFLLTWTLLALPLVYLLDASAVAALCWLGALGWALASGESDGALHGALRLPVFLLLAALPLPHLLRHLQRGRGSARVAWLLRVALAVLVIGYAVCTPWRELGKLLPVYAAMSAAALLAGRHGFSGLHGLWGNPLEGAGLFGLCALALISTADEVWRDLTLGLDASVAVPALLTAVAAILARRLWRQHRSLLAPVAAAWPLLVFLMAALDPIAAALLGHLYVLVLAGALIRAGLVETRLGLANLGAALLAALVLLRFFDSDLSYVLRGLGFILTGAGFFGAVLWLRRRLRSPA